VGRKIGAVVAFVIGGAVAGASGIMLFSPETPGAFALAPVSVTNQPVLPAVVAVAPAASVQATAGADDGCRAPACEPKAKSEPFAPVPADQKPADAGPATAPAQGESAKPVTAAIDPKPDTPAASTPSKTPAETDLHADFLVSRPIASVMPQLAVAFTAAAVPAVFLASRPIASTPHALVSPALPALAARPKAITTTAVALPAPAEEAKPAQPAKPRKTAQKRPRNNSQDYYRRQQQQNFFSFFWR
jgi:5'-nucleotidase